jgi:hypothetical protein
MITKESTNQSNNDLTQTTNQVHYMKCEFCHRSLLKQLTQTASSLYKHIQDIQMNREHGEG